MQAPRSRTTVELVGGSLLRPDLTVDRIAAAAGVTVQTVIRHFGGRAGAFEAAVEREVSRVRDERDPSAVSSTRDAVHQLVAGYERLGDQVIILLIVAVCDVYAWKLLRRDAGLGRAATELAIAELLTPLVEDS